MPEPAALPVLVLEVVEPLWPYWRPPSGSLDGLTRRRGDGALRLLHDGESSAEVAAAAGYADQPHLHREVRDLTGISVATLRQDNGQKMSTDVPSGSVTVA